jgi:DNA-directed RNA polymerase specialized sigma24 family protein
MADREPKDVDWGRVFADAVHIARAITKRDAEEIVQEAMVLFFAGKAAWGPAGKETLAQHLVTVGLCARRKKERTERRRRHPKVVGKMGQEFDQPPATPEDDVSEAEEKTKRFEQLLADFASDPEARDILLLVQQGVHDALAQAQRSGRDIEVVRNARKRIKRRLRALAEQDEEEAVKP